MLQKISLLSLTVLLLACQACAQNQTFVSTEGRFSIDLSSTPIEESNSPVASVGGKKLWWKTGNASFSISYADNPNAKKELAEGAVNASADAFLGAIPKSAELVSRKKIVIDGYPGIEVKVREPDGYTVLTRYYMVETRLYCVMALWNAGRNDADVIKTVDSFKVSIEGTPK